ncbi:MAG: hypothetical protein VKK62_04210 [Synechococcaceae cyanobacterium]|nr:hypothetical protein [Synechococcaceae cyanobacterium]
MTNLQQGTQRVPASVLQRIWLFAPIGAGAGAALLLGGLVLFPLWANLDKDLKRLQELEALQTQVALWRRELSSLEENREKAEGQRNTLIRLISGSRDQSTFLARLDAEAAAAGVQLQLFEPKAPTPPPTAGQPGQPPAGQPAQPGQPPAGPPPDPLALEGLQQKAVLLSAHGPYPNLLAFLRRIELLDVLVSQSDLTLQLDPPSPNARPGMVPPPPQVTLKLSLSRYEKQEPPPGAPAAAAAPGAPPASPVVPGS